MLSGRRKLLLADDSPTVQKVISLFLEEEGIEVVAVGDGAEALRLLNEQTPPDILIADVWMPGPDGYELCERVRADERLRHIPVILLVSKFEPFNEAEARRVGADMVLTKPFQSIRDLVSRVGSLLGGGPKQEEPAPDETPREESAAEASRAQPQAPHAEAAPHVAAPHVEQDEAFDSDLAEPFANLGADDELIEAKPAESYGGAGREDYSTQRPRASDAPERHSAAASFETARADESARTDFETARAQDEGRAAAPEEIEVSEHAEEFETSAHAPDVYAAQHGAAHEAFGTNGQVALSHEAQPARHAGEGLMPARNSFAARAASASAADDALLDIGQFEPPASGPAAEADDFILDLEEDLPAPPDAQHLFAQTDEQNVFAQTDAPSAFAEASHSAQRHPSTQGHDDAASEVVMQESEVVMQDEPQSFASPSFEHDAGSEPRGFVEPSVVPAEEPVPATIEGEFTDGSVEGDVPKPPAIVHAAPPVEDASSAAHEMSAARETSAPSEPSTEGYAVGEARVGVEEPPRAGQLSREDVDAIARRVVELMSERVVREIAWEVVPELAELLVKRKLEEEGRK